MKINLSDSTFIIPLRIESNDRLRNIITILAFLIERFQTNILIKEVDEESNFLKYALPILRNVLDDDNDIQNTLIHIFEKSIDRTFHRQKIINEMVYESSSNVIVNYDCDVILPVDSYINAYTLIMNGDADVVYPYGQGSYQKQVFATDDIVSKFLETGDYSEFDINSSLFLSEFGWVQFFDKKVYINGGLENENFVSYAPEDKERFYRFTTLGYNVKRINNFIYHLEHQRGHNSWFSNPFMESNNCLWEQLQKMNKEELIKYYSSQEYLKKYGQK